MVDAMDEAHLAAALRYVSLNPVRARLVEHAQNWNWSSTSAHLRGAHRVDGEDVRVICPTCQSVSRNRSKHPCRRHHSTLHGVVLDILVAGGGHGARAPLPTLRHRPPSGPITRSGRAVEIPGTKHSTTTASIIRSTNGNVPQITSISGISGATLRMTKILRPTGG